MREICDLAASAETDLIPSIVVAAAARAFLCFSATYFAINLNINYVAFQFTLFRCHIFFFVQLPPHMIGCCSGVFPSTICWPIVNIVVLSNLGNMHTLHVFHRMSSLETQ